MSKREDIRTRSGFTARKERTALNDGIHRDPERALLGALLLEGDCIARVAKIVHPDDFSDRRHGVIFGALLCLADRGMPVEFLTAGEVLREDHVFEEVGGYEYLIELAEGITSSAHVLWHARMVAEAAVIRKAAARIRDADSEVEECPVGDGRIIALVEKLAADLLVLGRSDRIGRAHSGAQPVVVRLSDVEPEEVRWLWEPYIPLGKLTIAEGDPGVGKTWFALQLASIVTRGHPLPSVMDGLPRGQREPANVVYLTAEDGLGDTLRPRLDGAGADPSRVFALRGIRSRDPKTDKEREDPFTLDNLEALEHVLKKHAPALVVVDPVQGFLGAGVDAHRANETRPILAACARLAERYGCAFVLIRHLGKTPSARAIYRGLGSIDFAAAARSVLLVGKDPSNPEHVRAIAHVKSSLAPAGSSIGFELRQGEFLWTGRSDLTAGDLLAADPLPGDGSAVDAACEFLRTELVGGPRPSREMDSVAEREGIKRSTLKRARKKLGVIAQKVGRPGQGGCWEWALPSEGDHRIREEDQENHDGPDGPLRASMILFGSNEGPKPMEGDPGRLGNWGDPSLDSSPEGDPHASLEREALKVESNLKDGQRSRPALRGPDFESHEH